MTISPQARATTLQASRILLRGLIIGLPACLFVAALVVPAASARPTGAVLISDISPAYDLASAGRVVYIAGQRRREGTELWKSDGTRKGTKLVKDINRGRASSWPDSLAVTSNGTLFFSADDGKNGTELWRSNGTAIGTRLLKNIRPGRKGGGIDEIVALGKKVYFKPIFGNQLWESDGTRKGTKLVPGAEALGNVRYLTRAGSSVYFDGWEQCRSDQPGVTRCISSLWRVDRSGAARVKEGANLEEPTGTDGGALYFIGYDPAYGAELWKSDGTEAGTTMIEDIIPGASSANPEGLTAVGDRVFFTTYGRSVRELWTSDGTASGTRPVRAAGGAMLPIDNGAERVAAGGTLFWTAGNATGSRFSLWRSDGTPSGSFRLRAFPLGGGPGPPTGLTPAAGRVYFTTGTFRGGLWTSDGTRRGTVRVSRRTYEDDGTDGRAPLGERLLFGGAKGGLWATTR